MFGMYCIYDRAAKKWSPPAVLENDAVALRMFKGTIAKSSVDASDYTLFKVGIFDEYAKAGNAGNPPDGESGFPVSGLLPIEVDTAAFFKGD